VPSLRTAATGPQVSTLGRYAAALGVAVRFSAEPSAADLVPAGPPLTRKQAQILEVLAAGREMVTYGGRLAAVTPPPGLRALPGHHGSGRRFRHA